jgi:hypothetical protein
MNHCFRHGLHLRLIATCIFGLLAGISAFAGDTESEHWSWLLRKMAIANAIKPGTPVEPLLELFRRQPGIVRVVTDEEWSELRSGGDIRGKLAEIDTFAWTYCLRSCPWIKIDVKFLEPVNSNYDPKPGSKIKWVSKPYLEHEVLD